MKKRKNINISYSSQFSKRCKYCGFNFGHNFDSISFDVTKIPEKLIKMSLYRYPHSKIRRDISYLNSLRIYQLRFKPNYYSKHKKDQLFKLKDYIVCKKCSRFITVCPGSGSLLAKYKSGKYTYL